MLAGPHVMDFCEKIWPMVQLGFWYVAVVQLSDTFAVPVALKKFLAGGTHGQVRHATRG